MGRRVDSPLPPARGRSRRLCAAPLKLRPGVSLTWTYKEGDKRNAGCGVWDIQRFAFVRRGRSWVPSPLAGEGQGEGKSSGNESTHPNEKCCKYPIGHPLSRIPHSALRIRTGEGPCLT